MTTKTIFWIIGAWVVFNAIIPLYINSVERLYQGQIDSLTQKSISLGKLFLLRFWQFIVILMLLPFILGVLLLERIFRGGTRWIEALGVLGFVNKILMKDIRFIRENREDFSNRWRIVIITKKERG